MNKRLNFFKKIAPAFLLGILTFSACSDDVQIMPPPTKPLDEYMNTDVYPGDDFYQYANGTWLANTTLPEGYKVLDKLRITQSSVKEQMRQMFETTSNEKLSRFYRTAMNTQLAEQYGMQTARFYLDQIDGIGSRDDLQNVFRLLYHDGFSPLFNYDLGISTDPTLGASKYNKLNFVQGGRTLDIAYYKDTESNAAIIQTYRQLIAELFKLLGRSDQEAEQATLHVWETEKKIAEQAKFGYDRVETWHPNRYMLYPKRHTSRANTVIDNSRTKYLLSLVGLTDLDPQALHIDAACQDGLKLLEEGNLDQLKDYLTFRALYMLNPTLPAEYGNLFNVLEKQLTGNIDTRHEKVLSLIENTFSTWAGQEYADTYFNDETEAQITQLAHNLKATMRKRLEQNTWLDEDTRASAIEKLNHMQIKIGSGNKKISFDTLDIGDKSYAQNLINLRRHKIDYLASRAGAPIDMDDWTFLFGPQIVNACAVPYYNAIYVTAAILQSPFYDISQDIPELYGSVGMVIGHEITHNYDNIGSMYDKFGNRKNWWTDKDRSEFVKRGKWLSEHYTTYEVKPGVSANGQKTLSEDIADLGGLHIAFEAMCNVLKAQGTDPYAKVNGYSPAQRFFIAYAHLWAAHYNDNYYNYLLQTDVHSVAPLRVNGPLPLMDEWYKAFDIDHGRLYKAPENRIHIW